MLNYIKFIKIFIKENKNYIFISLFYTLFLIFLFIITPITENEKNLFINSAKKYIENIITENNFQLFINIFLNNSIIALIIFLGGFFLSLISILIVFSNVFIIGAVISFSITKVGLLKSLLAILPHGIIEISAILFSLSLSFKITHIIIKKLWNWKEVKIKNEIKKSFLFFGNFILLLILLAATIETFITPLFLYKF